MDNVISEYRKWKQQGDSLRSQAKQAMETRFRDLLLEAARVAQEYHADFGASLKPPPAITVFRYKAAAGKAGKAKKQVKPAPAPADPKIAALEKRLSQTRGKIETAKAAGKATRNLEDQAYEIEDALRLASQSN